MTDSTAASLQGLDATQSATTTTPLGGGLPGTSTSSTASPQTFSTASPQTSTTTPITGASRPPATLLSTQTASSSLTTAPSVSQNVITGSSSGTVAPVTHVASSGLSTGSAASIGVGCAVVGG